MLGFSSRSSQKTHKDFKIKLVKVCNFLRLQSVGVMGSSSVQGNSKPIGRVLIPELKKIVQQSNRPEMLGLP